MAIVMQFFVGVTSLISIILFNDCLFTAPHQLSQLLIIILSIQIFRALNLSLELTYLKILFLALNTIVEPHFACSIFRTTLSWHNVIFL